MRIWSVYTLKRRQRTCMQSCNGRTSDLEHKPGTGEGKDPVSMPKKEPGREPGRMTMTRSPTRGMG